MSRAIVRAAVPPARGRKHHTVLPGTEERAPSQKPRPAPRPDNLKLAIFRHWLASPELPATLRYYVGELGRDAEHDPDLAELADAVRQESCGEFLETSVCGHPRYHTSGSGRLEVTCVRQGGELVHICRRRAGTASKG